MIADSFKFCCFHCFLNYSFLTKAIYGNYEIMSTNSRFNGMFCELAQ